MLIIKPRIDREFCNFCRDSVGIFTALHGMQTQSSDENSVRLSVKRVHCDVVYYAYDATAAIVPQSS